MCMMCIHVYDICIMCTCSGDEDDNEEPLDWLPIAPEIEDPEEAGWGHLEVQCNVKFMDINFVHPIILKYVGLYVLRLVVVFTNFIGT